MKRLTFPGNRRFAFTIMDDTDVGTVENLAPIYGLFESLGMRVTKTVWPMDCPEGSKNFSSSQTLADVEYRDFVVDLQRRGFEIASHGATMESSTRERTVAGLERMREVFGSYPRVHANHSHNRDNIYWGAGRVDAPLVKPIYRRWNGRPDGYYQGHVQGSAYWWGDLCQRHIAFVRNLTFHEINLLRINPSMPYHDPSRPLVRWWFSGVAAEGANEFNALLQTDNQERLEREGGVCIVATHLGKGFADGSGVHPVTRHRLEELASRGGWFPPVGELLDWLKVQRGKDHLPAAEWRSMQRRWAVDLAVRKWKQYRERRERRRRQRQGALT